MNRAVRPYGQAHRPGSNASVVDGLNEHVTTFVTPIDDAYEALAAFARRREVRHDLTCQHGDLTLAQSFQDRQGVVRERVASYVYHQQLFSVQQRRKVLHVVVAQMKFSQQFEVQGREVCNLVVANM